MTKFKAYDLRRVYEHMLATAPPSPKQRGNDMRKYMHAFPDFDRAEDMERLLTLGYEDTSWPHDACPKAQKGRAEIFVDYGPERRAVEWGCAVDAVPPERFGVYALDEEGCYDGVQPLETANLDEALAYADAINRRAAAQGGAA